MRRLFILLALGFPLSWVMASKAGYAWHATGWRAAMQSVVGGALAGVLIAAAYFLSLLPRRSGDISRFNHAAQSFLVSWVFAMLAVVVGGVIGALVAAEQWCTAC